MLFMIMVMISLHNCHLFSKVKPDHPTWNFNTHRLSQPHTAELPSSCSVFFSQHLHVLHCFSRVQLFATLWTVALCPWDSPGKNTGVGCRALLQGILSTQGSNPGLLNLLQLLQVLYHQSHLGSPWHLSLSNTLLTINQQDIISI